MSQLRLDRFLTETTKLSRSEAKQQLKKGKISLNGVIVKKPELKVDPDKDQVLWDGKLCQYQKYVYYMLHKPQGVVSATKDPAEKTVLDLLSVDDKGLFPVGRLDKDTEGLLLITNDGDLSHRLLSPKKHVDKCYFARLDGPAGEEEIEKFAKGLDIGDEKNTFPAKMTIETEDGCGVNITIHEGRYHQIKRMAHAVGREVLYLKRLSMGSLLLPDDLPAGAFRPLTEEEIRLLLEYTGLASER